MTTCPMSLDFLISNRNALLKQTDDIHCIRQKLFPFLHLNSSLFIFKENYKYFICCSFRHVLLTRNLDTPSNFKLYKSLTYLQNKTKQNTDAHYLYFVCILRSKNLLFQQDCLFKIICKAPRHIVR